MTDDAAIEIPPTMRRTVALLRSNGFVVRDSGDVGGKEDHAHAFVAMLVERPALAGEADRAFRLLTSRGVAVPTPNDDSDGSEVCIEATYDPSDGIAEIVVVNLTDALLPEEKAS